jgi:uncharacterized membrane protein
VSPILVVRGVLFALGIFSAIAHWFFPRLTRPDLYFAVTVAPEFRDSPEGRSILRRYRRGLIGASAVTLALLATLVLTPALPLAPSALLLQLVAYFTVFYRARRLVLPHAVAPTTIREASVGRRNRQIPGGWVAASGPFALLAASAGYLGAHWQQISPRLILHWSAHGQPDRWAARSLGTVFLPVLVAAAILLALTLLLYGIAHWLRPIYAGGLKGEHESRFRRTASTVLLVMEYWIAVLFSWLAIRPLLPASLQRPPTAIATLAGLIAVVGTAALMWLGQGGNRIPSPLRTDSDSTGPVGDRTEDRFWKLGVFYFNRNDPSVMVERRFGIGYTVNFAHPVAWIIILLPVLTLMAVTATIAARHGTR